MVRHVLAFDLDLTLVDHLGDINLSSSVSVKAGCIPHRRACDRVRRLVEAGHEVHVISGRGQVLRNVTRRQLTEWVHEDLSDAGRLHLQAYFTDYAAMRTWKAQVLRTIGAEIYVGDQEADSLAADDAGIPFLHADRFRAGDDLLVLVGEKPETEALLRVPARGRTS
jgi:phosphoglycolate phosphatase-like HAD superfamily hydrolase